jgi:hypothetical protein
VQLPDMRNKPEHVVPKRNVYPGRRLGFRISLVKQKATSFQESIPYSDKENTAILQLLNVSGFKNE